ncbi:hypothetical protein MAPG_01545 [Magnaporthiopsis poae ATCC 64411]|uniref:Major facilitator superfamily (MFS) profile domain-containing protein n=1 Tax=Magnaporthiopsis poae (strain ATCC 64411 / 73-15) TaxID=644358 RepID=A0A0C4DNZ6_MAGP6|nr:hypothetical protein MAPG_01545 [Magnaporthiopsis poae ATCC 64411]
MPPQPTADRAGTTSILSAAGQACSGLVESAGSSSTIGETAEVVFQIPARRRWLILSSLCWASFPLNFVSNPILAAIPEVAADLDVPATAVTNANSAVLAAMALSAFIWLPLCGILGRRTALLSSQLVVVVSLLITSLSPNLACFATFWALAGSTTPFFLVAGQTIITDVFEPTIRGTATGYFLGVSVVTNLLAPLSGALIATYTTWRVVFGITSGTTLIAFSLCFFLVPSAQQLSGGLDSKNAESRPSLSGVLRAFDPSAVFRQLKYPRVLFCHITAGLLGFNMYAILSSVRRIINPRFNLTSPLTSGLFYLAPGIGSIVGSTLGGVISDWVVKRYIVKRKGLRIPQDRLRACIPAMLLVMPLGTMTYGWSVQKEVGGMVLPAAGAFIHGFGLMVAFSSLNTYAGEVIPEQKTAVISSKYMFQYGFASAGIGGAIPMIDRIGVGWAVTITTGVIIVATIPLVAIIVNPALDLPSWLRAGVKDSPSGSEGQAEM